uniref:Uncharacterized protein n=1 Tax=Brassica oleracea var. oleracea TaxID=109376 RepID=A0A0D3D8L8_BRAOL
MPATVNASRAPTFQPHLTAGAMYSIAGFDVARCNPNFRLSDSSLLVQFSDAISLNEFTEPISPIPEECFRFRSQRRAVRTSEYEHPTSRDIIGEITTVKITVSDSPEEKNRDGHDYQNG